MAKISEFSESAPYDAPYVDLNSIIGKNVIVEDMTPFENAKGKGVHLLCTIDGQECRICSHGVAVVDTFVREEIASLLDAGDTIECRFIKATSKTNPTRTVIKVVDPTEE